MWPIRTASSGRPVSAASSPGGLAPRLAVLAGDQQEAPGRDEVLDRPAAAVLVVDPGVRQRRARARGRLVDADVVDRLAAPGVPSGTTARRLVGVAVLDVELVELHRLRAASPAAPARGARRPRGRPLHMPAQLRPVLLRACARARRRARVDDREVVDGVLQRALRVALVDRAPLGLVGVEQLGRRMAAEHRGELPAQVLRVVDRARQSPSPPVGGWRCAASPTQEHAARPGTPRPSRRRPTSA